MKLIANPLREEWRNHRFANHFGGVSVSGALRNDKGLLVGPVETLTGVSRLIPMKRKKTAVARDMVLSLASNPKGAILLGKRRARNPAGWLHAFQLRSLCHPKI